MIIAGIGMIVVTRIVIRLVMVRSPRLWARRGGDLQAVRHRKTY